MVPVFPLKDADENVKSLSMTYCDFCSGPIAASNLPDLVKRMHEYGWKIDQEDQIVCDRCIKRYSDSVN